MTKRGGARRAKQRPPVALVFGESENDCSAICTLARALRPKLAFEARRQPLVLIKGSLPPKAKENAAAISQLARLESRSRPVLAVLAHQDCDALEPAHEATARQIEDALRAASCPGTPIGVTPAWEIEAWWLVFPEAVGEVVEGWRDPDDYLGRDVGRVANAKEALARAVQPRPPKPKKPRPYHESDSIQIAHNVAKPGRLASFRNGRRETERTPGKKEHTHSQSFERFRSKVLAIGQ